MKEQGKGSGPGTELCRVRSFRDINIQGGSGNVD